MQTRARVIAVDGAYATVETTRTSACEGCHKAAEGNCSVCSLMGSGRKIEAKAYNGIGAVVGDSVAIESYTGRMLWYALLVFILPIVAGLGLWGISTAVTEFPLWQALSGVLGVALSFVGIFFYSKRIQKARCDIEITEILDKDTNNDLEGM